MKVAKARIHWLSPDAGGRKSPPTGPRYSTLVRFVDETSDQSDCRWSIVVEFTEPLNKSLETIADIWFLVSDAPHYLLQPGRRFELCEGHQVVAKGEVIGQLD